MGLNLLVYFFTEMFIRIPVKNSERLLNSSMIRSIYRVKTFIYFEYSPVHIYTTEPVWHIQHDTEEEAQAVFEKLATELRYREIQMK